jgi:Fe-S cluster assembly iron-binding protein IscA
LAINFSEAQASRFNRFLAQSIMEKKLLGVDVKNGSTLS